MDVSTFQSLWSATAVIFDQQQRFEALLTILERASDLDVAAIRDSLAGDPRRNDILLSLVIDNCSMPKALDVVKQIRGDDGVGEQWDFFNESLTAAAAASERLYDVPLTTEPAGGGPVLVYLPAELVAEIQELLSLDASVPDVEPNALLTGFRWRVDDATTCVAVVYNSLRGPFLDVFAVRRAGKVRTVSAPPRRSLDEVMSLAGLPDFVATAAPTQ